MSWRTVVITKHAKLSYKNNYLIVRTEEINMIHLSEINTVMVDSTQVSVTSALLCELIKKKIKVIFCDEKRNPISELVPYYGSHNSSKKVLQQTKWDKKFSEIVWTEIIKKKIENQARLLGKYGFLESDMLMKYLDEITVFDQTNREGHSAKVYFNCLFGKQFSREDINDINSALNYGYSILLSNFNKEIVANGYVTQLGIKHINEYNSFNLSCDLMEPFRIIVDEIVYLNIGKIFDHEYKMTLVNLLNKKVDLKGKEYYLTNAIQIYLKKVFDALQEKNIDMLALYEFK